MAVEVASLLARISLSLQGVPEVQRQIESVQGQLSKLGQVSELEAQRIQNLANQVQVAGIRAEQAATALNVATRAIETQGATVDEARAAYEQLSRELAGAAAEIEALQSKTRLSADEYRRYVELLALVEGGLQGVESETGKLANLYLQFVDAQEQSVSATSRFISSKQRLAQEVARLQGTGGTAGRGLRGFVDSLKNINNGSILTASSLISLAARFTKLGAVIGIVLAAVFKLWRAFRQAFDLRAQVAHLGQLSDTLAQLSTRADTARTQVLAFSKAVENSFRALGEARPEQATEAVVKLAEELRFLTVDKDLNRTVQLVREALRGNMQPLAEATGLSIRRLRDQVGDLTRVVDENVAINRRWAAIQAEVARNQNRINTAQENSITSFRDIKTALANLWDSIARLLGPSFGDLLEQVKKFIELSTPFVRGIAQGLIPVFRLLQAALALVNTVMEAVVETAAKAQRALAGFLRTVAVGIRPLQRWADFLDAGAQETENLLKAMREAPSRIDDFSFSIDGAASSLEQARAAARQFISDVRGGTGLIATIRNLGEASKALREGPDPSTALAFANAYEAAFTQVFEGGIEKIRALQEFFGRQFAEGRLGEKEFEALQKVLDATVAAYEPLQKEVNDFFGATQSAKTGLQGTTGAMQTATSAAYSLADGAETAARALDQMSGTYVVDIVQRVSTVGAGDGGGGIVGGAISLLTGGIPGIGRAVGRSIANRVRGGTPNRNPFVDETERLKRRFGGGTGRPASTPSAPGPWASPELAQVLRERAKARQAEENLDRVRRQAEELAGLFPRRGGGGGGGGGPRGATIEEIREFIQQVNRAIIAGIRGGKVFSPAGNAIPLTEGAFINARGGALVENVTIRGVWDFADPAAKREIVRQLREALQQFSKEVA